MSHLSTKHQHKVLDNPKRWGAEIRPPYFDVKSYQERIDAIVGKSRDGRPVIRLVWAPTVETTAYGETMRRYWVTRIKLGTQWRYISPPRWILEQRIEREQYVPSWLATRFSTQVAEGEEPIDKGEPPEEFYSFAYLCAEHDPIPLGKDWPGCCDRLYEESRRRCWGYYREPNDYDLQLISQAVRARDAMPYYNPYAPLTRDQLAQIEAAASMQIERQQEELEEYKREMNKDFMKLHGWRLTENDPTVLKHGRIHDLGKTWEKAGFRTTESGLVVPDNN